MTRSRMYLSALALAACLTAASPAWALKVGRLNLVTQDGRRLLKVGTDGAVQPVLQALDKKLVMIIPGGERAMGTLKVGKSPLRQIRFGREGKDLRVVLDLDRDVDAKVLTSDEHGFVVDLGPAVPGPAPAADAKAAGAVKPAAAAPAAVAAADTLDPALAGYTCRVVDLALSADAEHSELVISADGPASYKPSVKEGGKLVSLLFHNTSLAWSGDSAKLKDDAVQSVSVRQLNEGGEAQVRLDVRLSQKLDYSLQRDQNQLVLRFARPEKAVAAPKSGDLETPVSLAVQDADLVGVLKTLSEQAGFEYQFTQSLLALAPPSSLVTAKIDGRSFREVIDTLLAPVQMNFLLQGNTLFFGSASEIDLKKARLPLVQRTYSPKYLTIKTSLAVLISHFKRPDQVKLGTDIAGIDPRDHSRLLLVGTSEDVALVLGALARYDVPEGGDAAASADDAEGGGGQPRTQVFHLQYLDGNPTTQSLLDAAIEQLYPIDDQLPSTSIYMDMLSRSLVVTTQVKYLKKIEKLLARLDVRPIQVNIEGKIVEMDQGLSQQIGVQWTAVNGTDPNNSQNASFNTGIATDFLSQLTVATVQNGLNINATINDMVTNNKADVVSAPNITTRDNRDAKISIADTVVSVQSTNTIVNGAVVNTQSYTSQLIPLALDVLPTVSATDRRISLLIDFTLTTQSGQALLAGAPVPTTDQHAQTFVVVNNGETAVLGGLVKQDNTEQERKVPVLGDIPLLGMLFKFNTQNKQKKEVVIFITPTIVEE